MSRQKTREMIYAIQRIHRLADGLLLIQPHIKHTSQGMQQRLFFQRKVNCQSHDQNLPAANRASDQDA
jgi:hypothetical protein